MSPHSVGVGTERDRISERVIVRSANIRHHLPNKTYCVMRLVASSIDSVAAKAFLFASGPVAIKNDPAAASTAEDFRAWGTALMDWVIQYRIRCNDLPVRSTSQPNYLRALVPESIPESPEPWKDIMTDLDRVILPGLTHWEANRRFFAYFKPHSSYPAVLGEMLCAGLNVMGFDWIASPACTELECVCLNWLGKFLNLPDRWLPFSDGPGGAVIQGSAGEATIVSLLGAIGRYEARCGGAVDRRTLIVYCSDQTHAVAQKACMILGIGCLRKIVTSSKNSWTMTGSMLADEMSQDLIDDSLAPLAVIATTGTTTSCAFDDLESIGKVCKMHGLWLHVDGAYGGAYSCLPELSNLFSGLHFADSYCVNCHKKLLCPFDLCAMFVSDRQYILKALSLQPEYLRNAASESGSVIDFEHWQLPLGRRFRALKLWFVLRRYGGENIREHLRNGIRLREFFEKKISSHKKLEIAATPSLSLCCFRLKNSTNEEQKQLLDRLNAGGKIFLIHSKLGDRVILRLACGGLEQSLEDVEYAWEVISNCIQDSISEQ